MKIDVTTYVNEEDKNIIDKGWYDYYTENISAVGVTPIICTIKNKKEMIGGAHGYFSQNFLHIDVLWVKEEYRSQGFGSIILKCLEDHCRGYHVNVVDLQTMNEEALRFYRKNGYEVFGILPNYHDGIDKYFLKKEL